MTPCPSARLAAACLCLFVASCQRSGLVLPEPGPEPDTEPPSDSDHPDPDTEQLPDNDHEPWDTPALCAVHIHCEQTIPDEPKVPCQLRVASADEAVLYEGWAGIEIRGRSSSGFPKHQYAVELWEGPEGGERPTDLYGMGREADWILNGNYADRALFRNKLGYDLFRAFDNPGEWAAESVLCELELNGAWQGVFTLGERPERDDDRIDVANARDGSSWVLKNDDSDGFMAASGFYAYWQLVHPPEAETSPEALAAIRADVGAFQAAVANADVDPEALWAVVDLDSAVDFVILHELSRNNDAYYLSVHMWKDAEGPIHFSPWDLDLAFGGYPIHSCGWDAWVSYRSSAIQAFARSTSFTDRLASRWRELRGGPLADDEVLARMDRYTAVMGASLERNFEVWPIDEIDFCWSGDCYLCPIESAQAEQAHIRDWTLAHMAWMDEHIEAYR